MFKFFREIIDSVKEGLDEAKIEVEQENIMKEAEEKDRTISQIEAIPYAEKIGVALGAHFRVVIFGDWFTLFKEDSDQDLYPIHLYTFGDYPKLKQYKSQLQQGIKRDFHIRDQASCLSVLTMFFDIAGISKTGTLLEGLKNEDIHLMESTKKMWDISKQGVAALLSSVLSHIVTAATDVGYIEKKEALGILNEVVSYAKNNYKSWDDFNNQFFIGESHVGLNHRAGKSILTKYSSYLMKKKGSPWNNIAW